MNGLSRLLTLCRWLKNMAEHAVRTPPEALSAHHRCVRTLLALVLLVTTTGSTTAAAVPPHPVRGDRTALTGAASALAVGDEQDLYWSPSISDLPEAVRALAHLVQEWALAHPVYTVGGALGLVLLLTGSRRGRR